MMSVVNNLIQFRTLDININTVNPKTKQVNTKSLNKTQNLLVYFVNLVKERRPRKTTVQNIASLSSSKISTCTL